MQEVQQSTELIVLSKDTKSDVCIKAGVSTQGKFTYVDQLALKSALRLTWTQSQAHKRFLRNLGIKFDGEKKEQAERSSQLCEQTLVSELVLHWHKDEPCPDSTDGMIKKKPPVVRVQSLCQLVTNRLNEYERAGKLNPDKFCNYIWIKTGGNHGGGSETGLVIVLLSWLLMGISRHWG